MKGIYTGSLFAVLCTAGASVVNAQGAQNACEQDIRQIGQQLSQDQVDQQLRQRIEQLLASAASNPSNCEAIIADARSQLSAADTRQSGQQQAAQRSAQQGSQQQQQAAQRSTQQSAEQAAQRSTQQSAEQAAQRSAQQREGQSRDNTTNVVVDQPAADVDVRTPAPQVNVQQRPTEVTVEQQPPNVQITQPEPEVTVRQAEPNVQVQQAQPQVEVSQSEPQVQVRQAEPQVEVRRSGEADVDIAQADRRQGQRDAEESSQLARRSAGDAAQREIVGNNVVSRDGEEIGEISGLARSRTTNEVYALVDVGGFLGIGEHRVALPIQQAEVDQQGNLVTQMSRNQLEQMQEYDEQQYTPIDE